MIPIKDLLSQIQRENSEKKAHYTLYYHDKASQSLIAFRLEDILEREDGFIKIKEGNDAVAIPLHRIRKVKKHAKVIWERPLYP